MTPRRTAAEPAHQVGKGSVDRRVIHGELERARSPFHRLLDVASPADLRRPSEGTRWTNEQLLFDMLFGYLIVRALLVLVRIFGRLPAAVGRLFAAALDSATAPFNAVNYWGWGLTLVHGHADPRTAGEAR